MEGESAILLVDPVDGAVPVGLCAFGDGGGGRDFAGGGLVGVELVFEFEGGCGACGGLGGDAVFSSVVVAVDGVGFPFSVGFFWWF